MGVGGREKGGRGELGEGDMGRKGVVEERGGACLFNLDPL